MTKHVIHLLLSILLLSAQLLTLAHGLEHLGQGDQGDSDEVCELCMAASSIEHQAASAVRPILVPDSYPQALPTESFSTRRHRSAFFPRGPPLIAHA